MHNEVNFKNWTSLARGISVSGTPEGMLFGIYIYLDLNVAVSTLNSNSRAHVSEELCF